MRFKYFILNEGKSVLDIPFEEIVKDVTLLNNINRLTQTGTRSFLFKLENGNVLKITDDKSIYNYYKFTLKNPNNPYLLKFHKAALAKNNYQFKYNKFLNNALYVFELESLLPLTSNQERIIDELDKESDKIIKSRGFLKKKIPNYQVLLNLVEEDKYVAIKDLVVEWVKLFKELKSYKFLDFKADNVMRRSNNAMVIIDPIFNPD
jgi:hypothetical protein